MNGNAQNLLNVELKNKPAENYAGYLYRATVGQSVTFNGTGIHTGETGWLTVHPAEAGTGLVFKKNGTEKEIKVNPFNVKDGNQAVLLASKDWQIRTVEHLLCAMAAAGITDAIMETNISEVPILDGSSEPFYNELVSVGQQVFDQKVEPIKLQSAVWVVNGDRYIIALPSDRFEVTYTIDYPHPDLRGKSMHLEMNTDVLANQIVGARTFGFLRDVEEMRNKGLIQGGSLDNAVVLTDDGYLNELRFEDECIRHKILDLVGDLYLLGRPIQAHIIAHRAGHALDVALDKKIQTAIAMDELARKKAD